MQELQTAVFYCSRKTEELRAHRMPPSGPGALFCVATCVYVGDFNIFNAAIIDIRY